MMNRELLIKKIASEFNVDETEVSEYFNSIFDSLAAAFVKNKNVNISELGKFKIKTKPDEEGGKQKTILFSPVKKLADDVNYNFNELAPVQIRVLDEKFLKGKLIEEIYSDDEAEEIILLDFEGGEILTETETKEIEIAEIKEESPPEEILIHEEAEHDFIFSKEEQGIKEDILIPEETAQNTLFTEDVQKVKEDILIPEETAQNTLFTEDVQKVKEDILIPEETSHEIVYSREEHTIKEDILIPEETIQENPFENIHEEKKEEISRVLPPVTAESIEQVCDSESNYDVGIEKEKILEQLDGIVFPEFRLPDFEEIIIRQKLISKDKKIISEFTTLIKTEKKEEKVSEPDLPEKEEETILFIPKAEIPEVKTEEETAESELPKKEEYQFVQTEKTEEEIKEAEEVYEEKIMAEDTSVIIPDEKEDEPEIKKSNLQLEAELLKMLDERRKILEEIKKLEEINTDDLVDFSKPSVKLSEEKPRLFDDSTLDKPKQNIFSDDEDKELEDLLKYLDSETDIPKEPGTEKEINKETEKEKEQTREVSEEKTSGEIHEELKPEDNIEDDRLFKGEDINELESLMGSLYSGNEETGNFPEPKEVEPHLNNLEMKVFDKLIDEPVKESESPATEETKPEEVKNGDMTSFSELEKLFINFRTEKTEDEIIKKEDKSIPEKAEDKSIPGKEEVKVNKAETIKTYDDIFNLLEPNGRKKTEKKPEQVKEIAKKKLPPKFKIIIYGIFILIIIIASVLLYQRAVNKSIKENKQLPVTAPIDSTKVAASDSVVFADTNKIKESQEEDIVYDENDVVIKESEKGFIVQFGNYENQFELAKKIKELKDKKIYPNFEKNDIGGKQIYRLRIGPYKSLKEAKAVIPKL